MAKQLRSALLVNNSITKLILGKAQETEKMEAIILEIAKDNNLLTFLSYPFSSVAISQKVKHKLEYNKSTPSHIFHLLLFARTLDSSSVFYMGYLPLDLLKLILQFARLDHLKIDFEFVKTSTGDVNF